MDIAVYRELDYVGNSLDTYSVVVDGALDADGLSYVEMQANLLGGMHDGAFAEGDPVHLVYDSDGNHYDSSVIQIVLGIKTSDLATIAGCGTYDTALPQGWVDDVKRLTGEDTFGHFVWSYDKPTVWGSPFPITRKGSRILAAYDAVRKV